MGSVAGRDVEGRRVEGMGRGQYEERVSDTDEVEDAGDLFVRDASGTERRCYVAADASEAQSGSAREHGGTARPLVRELSAESVHAIDRLTALLVDDYSNVYSVEQWDAEASHDSHTARKVLMNSNSVRVVPYQAVRAVTD